MKRRDILKAIGIGGILPFVKHKTPQEAVQAPEVKPQISPGLYALPSVTVSNKPLFAVSGTVFSPYGWGLVRVSEYTRYNNLPYSEKRKVIGVDANGYLVTGGDA